MYKLKILILEDNSIVAFEIKRTVEKLGYGVTDTTSNFEEAINSMKSNPADIAIMDIDLGENSKDGIETAKEVQKIKHIPIIFLTAFSDNTTLNKAIKLDPIFYLTKPFKREDLKTNLLIAQTKIKQEKCLVKINEQFSYDLINNHLFCNEEPIKLSKQEKKLFNLLVEAKGNLVSFETIEYEVWPDGPVSNSSLRTLLYRLRIKLQADLIETIQSFGCKLKS
ncbi:response regulator [Malaciobacter mytili]|uniref:response regulator n=1 Tax=Malaciobacter mytili TaxID=603050 RepID=UPI003A8C4521